MMSAHLHEICLAKIIAPFLNFCVTFFLFFGLCTVHLDLHIILKQAGWFL